MSVRMPTTLSPDEIKHRANLLIPWHRIFVSRSGVRFGDGQVPIDTEKTTYVRECLEKLGGSICSAIDLGSYEGYHSIQLAELPGVERVVGLEGRARNVAKANFVNECTGYETVRFHVYDLEEIGQAPLPEPGPFDLVFCAGVLYHLSRPWEVVRWMSQACSKYLFIDTHHAELPLYRCGPYHGEIYPEMDTETCGLKDYAFWPTLDDLLMMLMQNRFVPRFIYRYSVGHEFQPRVWIFAEKGESSAEFNGINPLRPELRETVPPLDSGPVPSAFHSLETYAAAIKAAPTPTPGIIKSDRREIRLEPQVQASPRPHEKDARVLSDVGPLKGTLLAYRVSLSLFIAGVIVSGLTAFPLLQELSILSRWLGIDAPAAYESLSGFRAWIAFVFFGLEKTYAAFPFIGYGTDWLAFGHLIIALFFVGPFRNPVRNAWVLRRGLVACAAVIPLALICGYVRHIPLAWRLIDCSFGIVGAIPLLYCLHLTKKIARST
jgi:hypothetical protein